MLANQRSGLICLAVAHRSLLLPETGLVPKGRNNSTWNARDQYVLESSTPDTFVFVSEAIENPRLLTSGMRDG
jgi:hypothetical protein